MKSQTSVLLYRGVPIPFEYTFIGTKQYVFEVTLEESGQILPVLRGMYQFPYPVEGQYAGIFTIIGRKQSQYPVISEGYRLNTVLGKKISQYPIGTDFYRSPTVLGMTVSSYPVDTTFAPIPPKPVEQYYNYNSLLITGTGGPANGSNNSIVDSSPFNLTLFKYGDTTQGSYTPYSTIAGYWSVYFGNTGGGYLTVPAAATALGTGDYTVEAWINLSTLNTSTDAIISNYNSGTNGLRILINVGTAGGIRVYHGNTQILEEAGAITSTQMWNHIAVVRSSGTTVLYVNGQAVADGEDTNNYGTDSTVTAIGASLVGGVYSQNFPGYISNLRVVGQAVYNGNFTPRDIPLRAITGTTLLICQDNRYRDRSVSLHQVNSYGSAAVSAVSPYLPPVTYNVTKFGGSLSFLGEFNFLYNFNTNSANVLSGDFTMEGWFYFTAGDIVETQAIYTNFEDPFLPGTIFFGKSEDVGGCVSFWAGDYDLYQPLLTDSELPPNNCWTHYAVVKNGSQCTLYKNGISISTATFEGGLSNTPGPLFFATHGISPGFYLYKGYVTDFRIVNGTALYTTDFIPPSGPLAVVPNTSLLLGGRAATMFDAGVHIDVSSNGVITNASAFPVNKWGTGSMYFDGQSTLSTAASDLFNFSGGTWTVEGWFYVQTVPSSDCPILMIGTGGNTNSYAAIVITSNMAIESKVPVVGSTAIATTTSVFAFRTWTHIAVSMNNGLGRIFVNGILRAGPVGGVTQMSNVEAAITIGADPSAQFGSIFNGAINDLRITKGVARYTGNFTPPGPL